MGLADAVTAAVILAGALYLLYRSLWKGGGSCHGCASSGACGTRARAPAPLVRLAAPPRPGAGGAPTR
jgi:hypothetical protein